MIRVNLLPPEDRPASRSFSLPHRTDLLVYAACGLVLLLGLGVFAQQALRQGRLETRLATLRAQEAALAEQTRLIDELEAREIVFSQRLARLRELETVRFTSVEWLNALNGVVPGQLWLLQVSRNQQGGRSTVEGIASGYRPISELMRAMEADPSFKDVQLIKAERQDKAKNSVIHFTVAAAWASAPPTALAAGGKP